MTQIGCVVLAGGLATRMGGGDKGFKEIDGKAIIQRVIDTVKPQVSKMVVNANGDPKRFDHLGLDVVSDHVDGFVGPLAGIHAGMTALENDFEWMLTVPTDTPFLPVDLVERLFAPIKAGEAEMTIAHSDGFDHPVIGIWPTSMAAGLKDALVNEDIRKMKKWIGRFNYKVVEWDATEFDPFFNANSMDDINVALEIGREKSN